MASNSDGALDPGQALRLLDLACNNSAGHDIVMLVESKGAPVEGESTRVFEDGKPRMDMLGLMLSGASSQNEGAAQYRTSLMNLVVVRQSDAASATLANLFKNQATDLKVQISCFKSGGDASNVQPTLEIALDAARITMLSLLTGDKLTGVNEALTFAYQGLEIRSAPQRADGQRGAVRVCKLL